MGKRLWRKHSYVRIEDDEPGCVWALFRAIDFHRWSNVKRLLPYKKPKPQEKTSKCKGKPNQISQPQEWEDAIKMSSASGNLSTSGTEQCYAGSNAPTLISLLKANPKIIRSVDSSNLKLETSVKDKDLKKDHVGILEIFEVNPDLFLKLLKDSPKKSRLLTKSGSFPFPNSSHIEFRSRTPSKVEHKHNEIWPIMNHGSEIKKATSQRIIRSSSLNESMDRYGFLFDNTSNKEIKSHLSRSLKLTNEKEFTFLGNNQGRRSFKERLSLSEIESYSFSSSEQPRASLEGLSHGESRGLRLDSLRDFGGLEHNNDSLAESNIDEDGYNLAIEPQKSNHQGEEHIAEVTIDELTSISAPEEVVNEVCPIPEDSLFITRGTSNLENVKNIQGSIDQFTHHDKDIDYSNEDLQYVKYVLDIVGLTTGEGQLEAWHSPNQPLDPALFDGIEVCCPFEPKTFNKDAQIVMSSTHRKILFDLINESLVDIHERSYTYYPKKLSSSCHIRPLRKGKTRVVEEVWEFVSKYLSWRPELDLSFDLAMAHDLSKDKTGWVNLQVDIECLALDLEDWILDDLLDEIVYC